MHRERDYVAIATTRLAMKDVSCLEMNAFFLFFLFFFYNANADIISLHAIVAREPRTHMKILRDKN